MVKTFPVPLSKEEMDKLVNACLEDEAFYMLVMVAKTTGRRLGEFYDVQVKDFIPDKNVLVTKVLKRRKRVEKEAILSDEVSRLIEGYIKRNHLNLEDYIFRKVGYRQIQNKVKYFAKKAGITKNVSFHNFRHYFITELVRQGWSYDKIAKLTGHSSVGTLASYDHTVASDIKDDAIKAIRNL